MVREARFTLPMHGHGMNHLDGLHDNFDDLDELIGDDYLPPPPKGRQRETKRKTPLDRKPDRRHLAGADWLTDFEEAEED